MGGVTTKQLIERQLKEMFGKTNKQDEDGGVEASLWEKLNWKFKK